MSQIVHPGVNSIADLLQPRRATDISEALMGAADWPTALVNEERRRLGSFEECIPAGLIRGQRLYGRGMKRDDAGFAELALPDCQQSFGASSRQFLRAELLRRCAYRLSPAIRSDGNTCEQRSPCGENKLRAAAISRPTLLMYRCMAEQRSRADAACLLAGISVRASIALICRRKRPNEAQPFEAAVFMAFRGLVAQATASFVVIRSAPFALRNPMNSVRRGSCLRSLYPSAWRRSIY